MPIATIEQLRAVEMPTLVIDAPELGDGIQLKIKGFTAAERAAITSAANPVGMDGKARYDATTDTKLTLIAAIAEPRLTLSEHGQWILDKIPLGLVNRIVETAQMLSGSTESSYEEMKRVMHENRYLRRLFVVCQRHFHRFPSELDHIAEHEFNLMLAALETQEDEEREAASAQR